MPAPDLKAATLLKIPPTQVTVLKGVAEATEVTAAGATDKVALAARGKPVKSN
jgi:hypothetical protein